MGNFNAGATALVRARASFPLNLFNVTWCVSAVFYPESTVPFGSSSISIKDPVVGWDLARMYPPTGTVLRLSGVSSSMAFLFVASLDHYIPTSNTGMDPLFLV